MIIKKGDATYTLRIAGRDYTLTSSDSAEHMHRMAVYVDRKIAETRTSQSRLFYLVCIIIKLHAYYIFNGKSKGDSLTRSI